MGTSQSSEGTESHGTVESVCGSLADIDAKHTRALRRASMRPDVTSSSEDGGETTPKGKAFFW